MQSKLGQIIPLYIVLHNGLSLKISPSVWKSLSELYHHKVHVDLHVQVHNSPTPVFNFQKDDGKDLMIYIPNMIGLSNKHTIDN